MSQRLLIIIGILIVIIGITWPWIKKLNLGNLPGDIIIKKQGFSFYFPLTTCIIISVVVSVLFWFFRK
jgi:hypothetical protein